MRRNDLGSLSTAGNFSSLRLVGADVSVAAGELLWGSSLGGALEKLRGRSVLLVTNDQVAAALALMELDGVARRMVLCPPDICLEHVPSVVAAAGVDAIVSDRDIPAASAPGVGFFVTCSPQIVRADRDRSMSHLTEWILLTSGTTGAPKMVLHTLSSLTGAVSSVRETMQQVVWSTFYDIRRYGGLQIFLRALIDGASLVLSSAQESTADFLARARAHGVTHISGTPSHWRRALMSPSARKIAPRYIRLSGEIVDQTILDNLRACYPATAIVHAFASTEAGVGFDVCDGLAGFPASLIGRRGAGVEMKVEEASLRIRSKRTASCYLGSSGETLVDEAGFVDTHDMVELRGNRYYFVGRRDGIINVGGMKVYPEEVEAVINTHPKVQMSLVKARISPITGAIVVADVVVKPSTDLGEVVVGNDKLKDDIFLKCREVLAPYKVPATIRFVPSLDVAASGKLARL
jgi:acyl-coenzyme A synthetase/AMP-(fatty) acid ligase